MAAECVYSLFCLGSGTDVGQAECVVVEEQHRVLVLLYCEGALLQNLQSQYLVFNKKINFLELHEKFAKKLRRWRLDRVVKVLPC